MEKKYNISTRFFSEKSINRYDCFSLFLILLLGLMNIPVPYKGDQALFNLGAFQISLGDIYLVDFWDLKQPGIYWFYLLGGSLFGFTEKGIHFFELIYSIIFSLVLLLTIKNVVKNNFAAALVPVFTVGFYYVFSSDYHLTQIEGIIGFPLYLSLWFSCLGIKLKKKKYYFIAGFCGGIAVLFKLIYSPVIISFLLTIIIFGLIKKEYNFLRIFPEIIFPYALGIFIPVILTLTYFYYNNGITNFIETSFVLPPLIAAEHDLHKNIFQRLIVEGIKWFLRYGLIIPLIIAGSFFILKKKKDIFIYLIFIWIISSSAMILLQRWAQYYYNILTIPIGILLVLVLNEFSNSIKLNEIKLTRKVAIIVILLLPSFYLIGRKVDNVINNNFTNYNEIRENVQFLNHPESIKGSIFVMGDPLFYYISGRTQAIPINGWTPEFLIDAQWKSLSTQLNKAKPAYILLPKEFFLTNKPGYKKIYSLIKENYLIEKETTLGIWYRLKGKYIKTKVKYSKIF